MRFERRATALPGAMMLGAVPARGQRADSVEAYNHRLSLAELGKAVAATGNLDAVLRADTSMAARVNPRTTAAGLTPRSYTVAMLSLRASARGLSAVRNGAQPASPAIADSIRLYQENKAHFQAWSRQLAAMRARPVSGDPDLEGLQATTGNADYVSPTPAAKNPDMERP